MSDAPPAETAAAPKKKSFLLIIIGAVVVLGLAGGGGYWYLHRAPPAAAKAAPEAEHGIVPFQPFMVNLSDPNASRFLRVTLQLVVRDEKEAERILKKPVILAQVRSAILEVLTLQVSDQLVTTGGKTSLKKAIAERVGSAIEDVKVLDVLFSDFVVQL